MRFRIGDHVQLNSGGPVGLVVSTVVGYLTMAWTEGEMTALEACFRRRANPGHLPPAAGREDGSPAGEPRPA